MAVAGIGRIGVTNYHLRRLNAAVVVSDLVPISRARHTINLGGCWSE